MNDYSQDSISAAALDDFEHRILPRLATTISMLYWRLAARPENDPYRRQTLLLESSAGRFLARLDNMGRQAFVRALQRGF